MPTSRSPEPSAPSAASPLERRVVLVVAAVQFVNILDFMIVMPLGPDFASGLGIPTSLIGVIAGSYTIAAALAGVAGSVWLDGFDRKRALLVSMCGLVGGTLVGGLATGLPSLLAARVVAGAFGGPATALAIAMVTDTVPVRRRGRALSNVMAAFSLASILGVPAGLEIAAMAGWRFAFFSVAALGAIVAIASAALLPSTRGRAAQAAKASVAGSSDPSASEPPPYGSTMPAAEEATAAAAAAPVAAVGKSPGPSARRLLDGVALRSLSATLLLTLGVFAVVPNISAYLQYNLAYPRDELGLLYLVGGVFSFVTLRIAGHFVDRLGVARVLVAGTLIHSLALWVGFIQPPIGVSVLMVFCLYMVSGSVRMVPMQSLATRVPEAHQRARFLSAQSALRHAGSALGALAGSLFLVSEPSGRLRHVPELAVGALVAAWLLVPLALSVESAVRRREKAAPGHAG